MLIKVVGATRYLVIIPIIGLALAAAFLFVVGGFGLIKFIIENILHPPETHGA
jgi:uncharacterized membrane protein YqhA